MSNEDTPHGGRHHGRGRQARHPRAWCGSTRAHIRHRRPAGALREPRPARRTSTASPTTTRPPASGPSGRWRRSSALSMLGTLAFIVAYFAIAHGPPTSSSPASASANLLHLVLGVTLGVSLLGIGFGAVHWAKTLMPDEEVVEERHLQRSSDAKRQEAVRRRPRRRRDGPAGPPSPDQVLASVARSASSPCRFVLQIAGALGHLDPGRRARATIWTSSERHGPDPAHARPRADPDQGQRRHHRLGLPRDARDHQGQHARPRGQGQGRRHAHPPRPAQSPSTTVAKAQDWGYEGIIAYSKICTHVGCAVGLYEQQTHHLLCPCHQSTFDVTKDCKVIFGPAKRPLPQLKITVDAEGYLVAPPRVHRTRGPELLGARMSTTVDPEAPTRSARTTRSSPRPPRAPA